jgi:hypothetical protein
VHSGRGQNIQRPGHRRRHGRHEDHALPVGQFLHDQGRDQRVLQLHQGRYEALRGLVAAQAAEETAQELVAGDLLEDPALQLLDAPPARPGPHRDPREEAGREDHQDGDDLAKLGAGRHLGRDGRHQRHDPRRGLEEQQHRQVDRHQHQ